MKNIGKVIFIGVILIAVAIWATYAFGPKETVTVTTVKWLPDSLRLWGQEIMIDSLIGEIEHHKELWTHEHKVALQMSQRARDLAALVAAMNDISATDSVPNLFAVLDTSVTLHAQSDSAGAEAVVSFGVKYDIGNDIWRDFRARIDKLAVNYLRAVTETHTTEYEKYIAWEWVAGFGGILALLIHLILK